MKVWRNGIKNCNLPARAREPWTLPILNSSDEVVVSGFLCLFLSEYWTANGPKRGQHKSLEWCEEGTRDVTYLCLAGKVFSRVKHSPMTPVCFIVPKRAVGGQPLV